ncbi:OadG family protein [Marinimicrobium sp. ARAG 43.8]|uniref:OadG family protein n=1 Tax=Marinimicrobium sp. ARAG 43.8 TaxID=3418719 RepID=UPI003CEFB941
MNETLLQQGLDLLLYGMGSVVVFLTLLVIATTLMSGGLSRWFPEREAPADSERRPKARRSSSDVDGKTLAIIRAAIEQHRARR